MSPVSKRILVQGGLTAALLAVIGIAFTELAGVWTVGPVRPGAEDLNPKPDSMRYRVPLTMALVGFVFVAGWELLVWRVRGNKPAVTATAKPAPPPVDDTERLLNELLAQAEAKRAAEARGQESGDSAPKTEGEKKGE